MSKARKARGLVRPEGIIRIVLTYKKGGEGSRQMRTIAYKGEGGLRLRTYPKTKRFLDHKISKLFFFCTKEAITLLFIIVFRKV